jgi:hypothetical protein
VVKNDGRKHVEQGLDPLDAGTIDVTDGVSDVPGGNARRGAPYYQIFAN